MRESIAINNIKLEPGKCFSLRVLGLVVLFVVLVSVGVRSFMSEPVVDDPVAQYNNVKKMSYGFTLKNNSASLLKGVEFWAYAPVQELSSQRCCDQIETSHPYEIVSDSLGNQALKFHFEVIPPYAQQIVHVTANVNLATSPNRLSADKLKKFLVQEPGIEVEDSKIKTLATQLQADDHLQTARNIYQWVNQNINKRDYTRNVKGALYALNKQKGDCTENAYLFVALARAAGVPARPIGGYMVKNSGVVRAVDYHNWAEFYEDGKWHIADPHQGVFDKHYEDYVATRVIALQNENDFTAHRYWHTGKGLSVRMN